MKKNLYRFPKYIMFIVALAHAGVGESVVTKLFSTLNIHCLAHSNLKERERERMCPCI